jgi:hypothetical protein
MRMKREIKDNVIRNLASRPQQLRSYISPPLPSLISLTLGPTLASDASTDQPMWSRSIHCFAVHPSSLVHSLALKGNTRVTTLGRHLRLPASLLPYLWLVPLKKMMSDLLRNVFRQSSLSSTFKSPDNTPEMCPHHEDNTSRSLPGPVAQSMACGSPSARLILVGLFWLSLLLTQCLDTIIALDFSNDKKRGLTVHQLFPDC